MPAVGGLADFSLSFKPYLTLKEEQIRLLEEILLIVWPGCLSGLLYSDAHPPHTHTMSCAGLEPYVGFGVGHALTGLQRKG